MKNNYLKHLTKYCSGQVNVFTAYQTLFFFQYEKKHKKAENPFCIKPEKFACKNSVILLSDHQTSLKSIFYSCDTDVMKSCIQASFNFQNAPHGHIKPRRVHVTCSLHVNALIQIRDETISQSTLFLIQQKEGGKKKKFSYKM